MKYLPFVRTFGNKSTCCDPSLSHPSVPALFCQAPIEEPKRESLESTRCQASEGGCEASIKTVQLLILDAAKNIPSA